MLQRERMSEQTAYVVVINNEMSFGIAKIKWQMKITLCYFHGNHIGVECAMLLNILNRHWRAAFVNKQRITTNSAKMLWQSEHLDIYCPVCVCVTFPVQIQCLGATILFSLFFFVHIFIHMMIWIFARCHCFIAQFHATLFCSINEIDDWLITKCPTKTKPMISNDHLYCKMFNSFDFYRFFHSKSCQCESFFSSSQYRLALKNDHCSMTIKTLTKNIAAMCYKCILSNHFRTDKNIFGLWEKVADCKMAIWI